MKYHNKKVVFSGITFDSCKERDRYIKLLFLQKAGEISNLQRQVTFPLLPTQYEYFERYGKKGQRLKDGKRCIEKAVTYKADFVYTENGKQIVEDTKGFKTKDYIIKRKLLLYRYGIQIKEI